MKLYDEAYQAIWMPRYGRLLVLERVACAMFEVPASSPSLDDASLLIEYGRLEDVLYAHNVELIRPIILGRRICNYTLRPHHLRPRVDICRSWGLKFFVRDYAKFLT
jgi:hypothetical protein